MWPTQGLVTRVQEALVEVPPEAYDLYPLTSTEAAGIVVKPHAPRRCSFWIEEDGGQPATLPTPPARRTTPTSTPQATPATTATRLVRLRAKTSPTSPMAWFHVSKAVASVLRSAQRWGPSCRGSATWQAPSSEPHTAAGRALSPTESSVTTRLATTWADRAFPHPLHQGPAQQSSSPDAGESSRQGSPQSDRTPEAVVTAACRCYRTCRHSPIGRRKMGCCKSGFRCHLCDGGDRRRGGDDCRSSQLLQSAHEA